MVGFDDSSVDGFFRTVGLEFVIYILVIFLPSLHRLTSFIDTCCAVTCQINLRFRTRTFGFDIRCFIADVFVALDFYVQDFRSTSPDNLQFGFAAFVA